MSIGEYVIDVHVNFLDMIALLSDDHPQRSGCYFIRNMGSNIGVVR